MLPVGGLRCGAGKAGPPKLACSSRKLPTAARSLPMFHSVPRRSVCGSFREFAVGRIADSINRSRLNEEDRDVLGSQDAGEGKQRRLRKRAHGGAGNLSLQTRTRRVSRRIRLQWRLFPGHCYSGSQAGRGQEGFQRADRQRQRAAAADHVLPGCSVHQVCRGSVL